MLLPGQQLSLGGVRSRVDMVAEAPKAQLQNFTQRPFVIDDE